MSKGSKQQSELASQIFKYIDRLCVCMYPMPVYHPVVLVPQPMSGVSQQKSATTVTVSLDYWIWIWIWMLFKSRIYFLFFIFFIFFFCLFVFLGPHPQPMEVPRLVAESELQLLAYTTATATWNPSRVCDLHRSSWQRKILNPLNEAIKFFVVAFYFILFCFYQKRHMT